MQNMFRIIYYWESNIKQPNKLNKLKKKMKKIYKINVYVMIV